MGKKKRKQESDSSSSSDSDDDLGLGLSADERLRVSKLQKKIRKCKDKQKKEALEGRLVQFLAAKASQQAAKEAESRAAERAAAEATKHKWAPPAGGPSKPTASKIVLDAQELARRNQRAARFSSCDDEEGGAPSVELVAAGGVGTCEALEKEYLRLTSLPRASDVRPPHVLAAALKLVKARWMEEGNYEYACKQLKSIRQDLTVQHVRDTLAVDAYETHARIALEVGDLAEFQQCHAVLRSMYNEGVPGNQEEFAAYSLLNAMCACGVRGVGGQAPRHALAAELSALHAAHVRQLQQQEEQEGQQQQGQGKGKAQGATPARKQKGPTAKAGGAGRGGGAGSAGQGVSGGGPSGGQEGLLGHPYVVHAMRVVAAFRMSDWAGFVGAYASAPRMSPYLMDRMLPAMRRAALQALITAHKPSPLPLPTLASALGFETVQEAGAYAEEQGAVVDWGPEGSAGSGSNGVLDTKLSAARPVGPPAPPAEQQQQQKAAAGAARQVGPQPALQQQTAKHKKHQEDEGAEGQKKKKKKKG